MKNLNLNYSAIKTIGLSILISVFFTSCDGQVKKNTALLKIAPEQLKVHEDSIVLRAETLPEFLSNPNAQDYQGNQISGVVRTVVQDKNGNLWFGTQNGLCRYNSQGLDYFDIMDKNGENITVYTIVEDKTGAIWIGYGGGIAKYDGAYFTNYYEKDILINSGLWSMVADKNGLLWIGTTQGVYTFNGEVFTLFEIPEGKADPTRGVSTSRMVHSIMEDRTGRMWFGTNGGAYIYDGTVLTNISEKDGLRSNFVNSIVEDRDGNFYISTAHSGVFFYDGDSLTNITDGILDDDTGVGALLEDHKGNIWFGAKGRGLYRYDGKDFTTYHIADGTTGPVTFQIYEDQQDRLWFVGFGGAYRYDHGSFVNITRKGPW